MNPRPTSFFAPPPNGWSRALWFASVGLALHGLLLAVFAALQPLLPLDASNGIAEAIGAIGFFVFAVPALILARPFLPLLWKLGLMNAPGWFAWPEPLGLLLVYIVWVLVLFGLAQALRKPRSNP
jgi:hypothetical protein